MSREKITPGVKNEPSMHEFSEYVQVPRVPNKICPEVQKVINQYKDRFKDRFNRNRQIYQLDDAHDRAKKQEIVSKYTKFVSGALGVMGAAAATVFGVDQALTHIEHTKFVKKFVKKYADYDRAPENERLELNNILLKLPATTFVNDKYYLKLPQAAVKYYLENKGDELWRAVEVGELSISDVFYHKLNLDHLRWSLKKGADNFAKALEKLIKRGQIQPDIVVYEIKKLVNNDVKFLGSLVDNTKFFHMLLRRGFFIENSELFGKLIRLDTKKLVEIFANNPYLYYSALYNLVTYYEDKLSIVDPEEAEDVYEKDKSGAKKYLNYLARLVAKDLKLVVNHIKVKSDNIIRPFINSDNENTALFYTYYDVTAEIFNNLTNKQVIKLLSEDFFLFDKICSHNKSRVSLCSPCSGYSSKRSRQVTSRFMKVFNELSLEEAKELLKIRDKFGKTFKESIMAEEHSGGRMKLTPEHTAYWKMAFALSSKGIDENLKKEILTYIIKSGVYKRSDLYLAIDQLIASGHLTLNTLKNLDSSIVEAFMLSNNKYTFTLKVIKGFYPKEWIKFIPLDTLAYIILTKRKKNRDGHVILKAPEISLWFWSEPLPKDVVDLLPKEWIENISPRDFVEAVIREGFEELFWEAVADDRIPQELFNKITFSQKRLLLLKGIPYDFWKAVIKGKIKQSIARKLTYDLINDLDDSSKDALVKFVKKSPRMAIKMFGYKRVRKIIRESH